MTRDELAYLQMRRCSGVGWEQIAFEVGRPREEVEQAWAEIGGPIDGDPGIARRAVAALVRRVRRRLRSGT